MDIKQFVQLLKTKLPKDSIFENELMQNYTTFKIGGNVDVMVKPTSYQEVADTVKLCRAHQIPYYISFEIVIFFSTYYKFLMVYPPYLVIYSSQKILLILDYVF